MFITLQNDLSICLLLIFMCQYIISGVISASIIGTISFIIMHMNNRYQRKTYLDNNLFSIQKMSFEHVFLEDDNFTKNWPSIKKENIDREKILMYDVYCEMIFNFAQHLSKYYRFNSKKINSDVNLKDWLRTHKSWWDEPIVEHSNIDTYEKKFKILLDEYFR